jgi:hypothetical protein
MVGIDHLDQSCHVIEALLPTIRNLDSATIRAELGRFVDQARTRQATPGQRNLVETATAVAHGQRPARAVRR